MKRKVRTDVPTLWLDEGTNLLRIIWPDKSVWFLDLFDSDVKWRASAFFAHEVMAACYYCGPLFVSKENEP